MNGLCRATTAALVALCAIAPTASGAIPAPPSEWYKLPGLNAASGAQWVRAFAYSTPPNIVYAGLEGGGVFKSTTGGATWSAFNDGFPNPLITNVRALLSSSTGTTVFAGTDAGLYKSTGGAWEPHAQGTEEDPANPKKLNESVQSLVSLTGGSVMLAGVFSGGVYKSTDGGDTWSPPPANSGIPSSETVYGLTENVPGLVYATAGSGVYVSTDQGSTWTMKSDGIPGSASMITTWAYPQRPQILFTSTGSNGIYRSVNAGLTWSPINNGLGAVRARGFQIFTASQGAHLYAATEEGLWEALNGNSVNPPPPRWHKVTEEGLHETNPVAHNVIMWSLTAPVIPGSGAAGLIAGTQSNGGYFISFVPPDSNCPTSHTTNTTTNCPRITNTSGMLDTTPIEGQTLRATNGTWTGTQLIDYAYQWQFCTSTAASSCGNIDDAEEASYVVPLNSTLRYRVQVTATNPAPTFPPAPYRRYSAITSAAGANPANFPGSSQPFPPTISVTPSSNQTSPTIGNKMFAEFGQDPPTTSDGWFNPPAASRTFQWLRCTGTDCNEIPGATSRTYTLVTADGTHNMKVRVTGTNASGSMQLTSSPSYDVISAPAAIAAPIPDPDGGPAKSQAPALSGEAYVGETLAGTVGGWKDPTTDFQRRWVRCDADGGSCTYIQQVATTDPETGPTYVVREEDLGYTLRLRVVADVNNDLTPDGLDNHLPHSVEVDTAPSAVVTYRPLPEPPPAPPPVEGPGGGVVPVADTFPPVISALTLTKSKFVAGKGTTFNLRLSEAGSVRVVITKQTRGRKVKGKCKPKTRKNRRKKACTFQKKVTTIVRPDQAAGNLAIPFNGKVGKRKLRPGRYTAKFIVTDAAGNVSNAVSLVFKIVRKRRG